MRMHKVVPPRTCDDDDDLPAAASAVSIVYNTTHTRAFVSVGGKLKKEGVAEELAV